MIDYRRDLNTAQQEAVLHGDGPLLVIAGAGSGKTRTLTYRVARLVEEGVSPAAVLLLTFTRKAAEEMLRRATGLLDKRCSQVSGGTFHSFAHRVLRRYCARLGFDSGFSIIDRADAENLIAMIRKEIGPPSSAGSFPRKQTLMSIFSRAVNKEIPVEDAIVEDHGHLIPFMEDILKIEERYRYRKVEDGFFDYDDLLVYLKRLLQEHPDLRERLADIYRHIMVDEYQDTNRIQAEIVYLLGSRHRNVTVVGDDSQSIYAFRGANFRNIFDFVETFPGTKIVRLEENYRSVQPILTLTNQILDGARQKFTKTLFSRKSSEKLPVLVNTAGENIQSRFVVETVLEKQRQGVALRDIAVLFRAGFHSFDLEIELNREAIPFVKVGGFKFMESAHIKDVLAHLRVMVNPSDRISWYRILLLLDKVGPKTAQRIYEAVRAENAGHTGILTAQLKGGANAALERLKSLFSLIDTRPMSLVEIGEAILNYYAPILQRIYDDHPRRLRDLEQLLLIMDRYTDPESFLSDMALEPPNTSADQTMARENEAEDRLVLSTVHSAKGLEWHTVFVIWALDGRFPSIHSLQNEEAIEEELRLMYVAATRAREQLFFTCPMQSYDRSTGMLLSRPSRFIEDIPESILARWHADLY
ncbi:MAG: ATP-dependent helicase [Desulfobacterales bacterium]